MGRKVALVTGASRCIGKATELALAEKGFDLVIAALRVISCARCCPGTVAVAVGVLVEAGLMSLRPASVPARRSSLAGFRFPPEVIVLAVRWYLRYGLSYRDVEDLLAERGITGITSRSTGGYSGSPRS